MSKVGTHAENVTDAVPLVKNVQRRMIKRTKTDLSNIAYVI